MMIEMPPGESFKTHDERIAAIKELLALKMRGLPKDNIHIDIHSLEEAKAALYALPSWNTFRPQGVFRRLEGIWDELFEVSIGWEGSPVMYLGLPYWTTQAHKYAEFYHKPVLEARDYAVKAAKAQGVSKEVAQLYAYEMVEQRVEVIDATFGNRRLSDSDTQWLVKRISKMFRGATEIDHHDMHDSHFVPSNSVRLWWD